MLFVAQSSRALNKKTGRFRAVKLHVANRTLYELSKIVFVKFVAFVVFEILRKLIFMPNLSYTNNC